MYKYSKPTKEQDIGFFLMSLFFVIVFWFVFSVLDTAHADTISDKEAVQCLLGEARGEGFNAMVAHAEAIRNRGHLKGVYGCKADFKKEMPYLTSKGIVKDAYRAWELSKTTNRVDGADHWGSLIVDKAWIKKMERSGYIRTATVNNTAFYKKP